MHLHIDIETYSPADLARLGVHVYAEHPQFEVLLFAYAYDDGPVRIVDLAQGELLPDQVLRDLTDSRVIKMAHNAAFERVCLSHWLLDWLDPAQWQCTMVLALTCGLPASLAQIGEVLRFEKQKLREGSALVRYFCNPCKPARSNGLRTRNLPHHDPEKWELFKKYCIRDVETEQQIYRALKRYAATPFEQRMYVLDQHINDRGVLLDRELVRGAIELSTSETQALLDEARVLTGLDNPNSVAQLKNFLREQIGQMPESLNKDAVADLQREFAHNARIHRVLQIRQALSKSSVKKYDAALACMGRDHKARGLFQFYGAGRTGRWAGRRMQLQNLTKPHISDVDQAREMVKKREAAAISLCYEGTQDVLSQLVRSSLIAEPGYTFAIADFSAIEARVVAWVAGEKWVLDAFRGGRDIYVETAGRMFHCAPETIDKHTEAGNQLRQKGKAGVLACGYGGGVEAFRRMGGERLGMTDEDMQRCVDTWRAANPRIVDLWNKLNKALFHVVRNRTFARVGPYLTLRASASMLEIILPSGRAIRYWKPRFGTNRFGNETVVYEGADQTTGKWGVTDLYGGKCTENIVQAISRDLLCVAIVRLEDAGFPIRMHVHDEIVATVPEAAAAARLEQMSRIMAEPVPWAPGLPLSAEGMVSKYYTK